MRSRIGTRLILGVGLVTVLVLGVMAALMVRAQRAQMRFELTRSANQLSETVRHSIHDDMLENRRESLHRQIESIGRQAGIVKVRLFNREGRIMFSSDASDIGKTLDKRAEACYACHAEGRPLEKLPIPARSRVFKAEGVGRILGIISPIPNETSCSAASCHAHDPSQSVLGVLDVTLSLAEADREIARGEATLAGLAGLAILASGLLLWWLNRRLVVRPVEALVAGTRRVAEGDLTTTIPEGARHELGDLAKAFNAMTRRLAETQKQLTQVDKLASVGRLAAGVAHEINNPLTGVLTYASFLQGRAGTDPDLAADLDVIVRETKRCREIVRGLLDFARQTPPDRRPTDMNTVVRHGVAVVMNQLALRRVELKLDLAESLPLAPADPNQIEQVVVNLLINAADAIGDSGGTIRVSTRAAPFPPFGHAPIRKAACPAGCDLLDPAVRIGGLPTIRVIRSFRGREDLIHHDPVYGRFNHLLGEAIELGAVGSYACPVCRRSLGVEGRVCETCGAPVFAIHVPGKDRVLCCARDGCHWSRWDAREAEGDGLFVDLVVEDSGRGIAKEDIPHLFEPFFTTKGSHGSGLGLAVTWGIVEGHDGTIEVESEPGRGTRFTIRLPLDSTATDGAIAPSPSARSSSGRSTATASPAGVGSSPAPTPISSGALSETIEAVATPRDLATKERR